MAERETTGPQQIQINALGGIDERISPANLRLGTFDRLEGLYPAKSGLMERIPGKTTLATLAGNPAILAIHQCNDAAGNILIQTATDVQVFTLDELLGRTPAANTLVPVPPTPPVSNTEEEEFMSQAILIHRAASGDGGGAVSYATWGKRTITDIVTQVNPDGTAASFVTSLASDVFTLSAGTYRVNIRCCQSTTNASNFGIRLQNTTAGANAFASYGLLQAAGQKPVTSGTSNFWVELDGWFKITAGANFEIQEFSNSNLNTRGTAASVDGIENIYLVCKILKTA